MRRVTYTPRPASTSLRDCAIILAACAAVLAIYVGGIGALYLLDHIARHIR